MTSTNYIPIWAFHTRLYYVPYIEYSKVFFLCIWKWLPASEMLLSIEGTFCHSNAELFVLYIVEALLPEVSPNVCVCTLQAMPLKLSPLNQGRPWRAGYLPILYISNPILSIISSFFKSEMVLVSESYYVRDNIWSSHSTSILHVTKA
jgi:hypothetical protein